MVKSSQREALVRLINYEIADELWRVISAWVFAAFRSINSGNLARASAAHRKVKHAGIGLQLSNDKTCFFFFMRFLWHER